MRAEAPQAVTGLEARLGGQVPAGPWGDPPHTAVVVPIASNRAGLPAGFLVAGISEGGPGKPGCRAKGHR